MTGAAFDAVTHDVEVLTWVGRAAIMRLRIGGKRLDLYLEGKIMRKLLLIAALLALAMVVQGCISIG